MQGILYIVATPIGNLQDITLRALEILKTVDLVAAEDTRQSKKLLEHYGIKTKMISLHDYNENERSDFLRQKILAGTNIALISDAGTPLISDPGYHLVHLARMANIKVVPIPGASAVIAALSAGGIPTDRFIFEGFLPVKTNQLRQRLEELKPESRTLVFYESPHRIINSLNMMLEVFGPDRYGVLARELTKMFETIHGASLKELVEWVKNDSQQQKGEMVLLIAGKEKPKEILVDEKTEHLLKILVAELPGPQAVKLAMKISGKSLPKKTLYQMMLELKKNK